MQSIRFLILMCLSTVGTYSFAQDCTVALNALQGAYTGDCKRGVAHGVGKASGIDSYEGSFKKGLPHGEGTYQWANGDVYSGTFVKGEKEGYGVLTLGNNGLKQQGYWLDDEYIGTEKKPYTIVQQSNSILRVTFKRISGDEKKIKFSFSRLGKPIKVSSLNVQSDFGVELNQTDYDRTFTVHDFPCDPIITFTAEANRDVTGSQKGADLEGNLNFQLRQSGSWLVTIEMQGTN